jgi:hypothetical protein
VNSLLEVAPRSLTLGDYCGGAGLRNPVVGSAGAEEAEHSLGEKRRGSGSYDDDDLSTK